MLVVLKSVRARRKESGDGDELATLYQPPGAYIETDARRQGPPL